MNINEKIKARSITSKASSACKINMGLVAGAGDVQNSKSFVDYGALMQKKLDAGGGDVSSDAGGGDVLYDEVKLENPTE